MNPVNLAGDSQRANSPVQHIEQRNSEAPDTERLFFIVESIALFSNVFQPGPQFPPVPDCFTGVSHQRMVFQELFERFPPLTCEKDISDSRAMKVCPLSGENIDRETRSSAAFNVHSLIPIENRYVTGEPDYLREWCQMKTCLIAKFHAGDGTASQHLRLRTQRKQVAAYALLHIAQALQRDNQNVSGASRNAQPLADLKKRSAVCRSAKQFKD